MKLGNKKILLIKILFLLLFILTISSITISYLYKTNNISREEYIKLLLSDTYGDNFYKKIVEMINEYFNPINMIEMKETNYKHFSLSNSITNSNPLIYVYSSNQNNTYKKEYNISPNLYLVTYLLSNKLNNLGIKTIFENNNIYNFSINNKVTIKDATNLFVKDKINTYPSIKYVININRNMEHKRKTTISFNKQKYAIINLYANKSNFLFITSLNNKLNQMYDGISKIYFDETYNDINIDIGGYENNMYEVLNSLDVLSNAFIEVIYEN